MADNLVSLNNNEENLFEFDLSIQNLDPKNVDARFVIRSAEMDLAFPCVQNESGKWEVKLPPLPMLERTIYPFHFAIVAENHHFTPLSGSVNVVGSGEVYVSTPKKKLTSPVKKIEEKKKEPTLKIEVPKPQAIRSREKSIEQLATELMESKKPTAKPVDKKAPSLAKVNYDEPKPEIKKEEVAPVVESSPTTILPTIAVEKTGPKKGEKDEAALRVLEELGIKSSRKPKGRFSIKN